MQNIPEAGIIITGWPGGWLKRVRIKVVFPRPDSPDISGKFTN